MLKDNHLASLELNRATALKFSEFFFSKKCRVMPLLMGSYAIVIPAQARDSSRRSPKGEVGSRHCAQHNHI